MFIDHRYEEMNHVISNEIKHCCHLQHIEVFGQYSILSICLLKISLNLDAYMMFKFGQDLMLNTNSQV